MSEAEGGRRESAHRAQGEMAAQRKGKRQGRRRRKQPPRLAFSLPPSPALTFLRSAVPSRPGELAPDKPTPHGRGAKSRRTSAQANNAHSHKAGPHPPHSTTSNADAQQATPAPRNHLTRAPQDHHLLHK